MYYDYGYNSWDYLLAILFSGAFLVYWLILLALSILVIIATWKVFTKAGVPGWASIIPFYNQYCLYKIAFGNGWLFLLCLVPCANFVIAIIKDIKLAAAFGKGTGFAVGLIFLNPVFMLILGFGDSKYIGASN